MSGASDNIVLEHLRHIRATVDATRQDIRDLTHRVGMLETQYAGLEGQIAGLHAQYAHVATRIDRVEIRLEKIERRIGLIDA
ncbi:MAG TPA: hypothetical protein VNU97_19875 [Rhizomicrobium sp.]|jgi:hypothetical protein|nr:hypothetical protein [Rhizomicrobium sp.]